MSKIWVVLLTIIIGILFIAEIVYSGHKADQAHKEKTVSRKIIFSGFINETWQIWSINLDGSDLTQLTHTAQDVHSPALSSGGNKLAYVNNEGEIWVVGEDRKPQRISKPSQKCAHPDWSPDGNKIAFVCFTFDSGKEDSGIWIAEIKEKKTHKLLDAPNIQEDPDWSPDGNFIVYTTGYWTSSGRLIEELWILDVKKKVHKLLIDNDYSNIQPCWSPDGEWIAFASDRTGKMEIWLVNKYGKDEKQLTRHRAYDSDPCWSHDGSKICFVSTRGGKMDLWCMDKDGKNVRKVTNVSEGDCKDPCWH